MIHEKIEDIKKRLTFQLLSTPPFLTMEMSPSNVALWSKFMDVIASEVHYMEQLLNDYETEIRDVVKNVTTPTNGWWQVQVLNFQYTDDPLNQQVIKLDLKTMRPAYPQIIPSYRVIKNASVTTPFNNIVQVKVTKGGAILTPSELAALNAYCETICPAGVQFKVVNELPDRLWLDADIYFNAQYTAIIKKSVIDALDLFLKTIPFDGIVRISEIEKVIKAVEGVSDVVINAVSGRWKETPFASRTIISRYWKIYAGEIIQEDEPGQSFVDTLEFKPEY